MNVTHHDFDHSVRKLTRLSLTDLRYALDGRDILKGITLGMLSSRIGIVGRNGSGKSTLARLLSGLVAPTSGCLMLNDIDTAHDRRAALSEVGLLFQNPDHQIIFPTVQEEIMFGLTQQGRDKRSAQLKTRQILEEFGKAHWEDAHVSTLSQGQKHLLCLMAIVAMQPKVIVLDEPFTGLDMPTKLQLNRYLARFDGGLIHISHDPVDLMDYDQVLWLEQGEVVSTGEALTVLQAYIAEMKKLGGSDDISDLSG